MTATRNAEVREIVVPLDKILWAAVLLAVGFGAGVGAGYGIGADARGARSAGGAAAEGKELYLVSQADDSPFWRDWKAGAAAGASPNGVQFRDCGYDVAKYVEAFETECLRIGSLMLGVPFKGEKQQAVMNATERCRKKNPFAYSIVNTDTVATASTVYFGIDNYEVGRSCARQTLYPTAREFVSGTISVGEVTHTMTHVRRARVFWSEYTLADWSLEHRFRGFVDEMQALSSSTTVELVSGWDETYVMQSDADVHVVLSVGWIDAFVGASVSTLLCGDIAPHLGHRIAYNGQNPFDQGFSAAQYMLFHPSARGRRLQAESSSMNAHFSQTGFHTLSPAFAMQDWVVSSEVRMDRFVDFFSFSDYAETTCSIGIGRYRNSSYAKQKGLLDTNEQRAVLKTGAVVDDGQPACTDTGGRGVDALRVSTHRRYSLPRTFKVASGAYTVSNSYVADKKVLFTARVRMMPEALASFPAWWFLGVDLDDTYNTWAATGEIDAIEGPGSRCDARLSVHCTTGKYGCPYGRYIADWTGIQAKCTNPLNGGVYAMLWTADAATTYFWRDGEVPNDVAVGRPQPETWAHKGRFEFADVPAEHMPEGLTQIFVTQVCGWSDLPNCVSTVLGDGGAEHVESLASTYWEISDIKAYETAEGRHGCFISGCNVYWPDGLRISSEQVTDFKTAYGTWESIFGTYSSTDERPHAFRVSWNECLRRCLDDQRCANVKFWVSDAAQELYQCELFAYFSTSAAQLPLYCQESEWQGHGRAVPYSSHQDGVSSGSLYCGEHTGTKFTKCDPLASMEGQLCVGDALYGANCGCGLGAATAVQTLKMGRRESFACAARCFDAPSCTHWVLVERNRTSTAGACGGGDYECRLYASGPDDLEAGVFCADVDLRSDCGQVRSP